MRYLETSGRWVSTDPLAASTSISTDDSTAELVDRGLLHPTYAEQGELAGDWLLKQGIAGPMSSYVRLTDGPGGQARWASYADVLLSNPWGFATIHTIARGLGRLPLKIYEPDLSDKTEPGTVSTIINPNRKTPGGRVAWALRYPNQLPKPINSPVSRKALLYSTVVSKLIHGNAVWEKRFDENGHLVGFTFIPNEQLSMDEEALVYTVSEPQYGSINVDLNKVDRPRGEYTLTADKVVHFGLWETGRRPWTPSPVKSLHSSIALYDAVTRHMVSFFSNGARVSGHLKLPEGKGNNQKARDAAREEIRKLYSGADNAGRVLVTEADWQQMHREPEFDGIVNLMKFAREEIFAVYGVPPPVMGVLDRAIMSNVEGMRDQYVRDLIGPHAEFLAADFEAQVIDVSPTLRDMQVFAEFDVDEQLRPDLWKRAENFRSLLLAYTPNELRQIERQQKLTGAANPNGYADTVQRPLNESPLNNLPNYIERDRIDVERLKIERDLADHTIQHGPGTESHGPVPPKVKAPAKPGDDEPAKPVKEEPDAGDE